MEIKEFVAFVVLIYVGIIIAILPIRQKTKENWIKLLTLFSVMYIVHSVMRK